MQRPLRAWKQCIALPCSSDVRSMTLPSVPPNRACQPPPSPGVPRAQAAVPLLCLALLRRAPAAYSRHIWHVRLLVQAVMAGEWGHVLPLRLRPHACHAVLPAARHRATCPGSAPRPWMHTLPTPTAFIPAPAAGHLTADMARMAEASIANLQRNGLMGSLTWAGVLAAASSVTVGLLVGALPWPARAGS